ncbi:MAG: imidazolonepropionase, partial [Planctomycetota bacterium]
MNLLPDLFIQNCGQLLTVAGASQRPKILQGMDDLGIILDGAVAIKDGKIIDVGTTRQLGKKYNKKGVQVIDAMEKVVLPGFVDCHTHTVFGGDRAGEFIQRMQGENYLEILKTGGGILSTVKNTRDLTLEKLVEVSKKRLDTMLLHGTTTVEIKSGYGLDRKSELKILNAIQRLQKAHSMDIVPTFLGAHTIPSEYQ